MDNKTVFTGWNYVIEETAYGPQPKKLGTGGYGNVFEIKREGSIDFKSAMKVINIPKDELEIRQYIAGGNSDSQIQQILEDRKAKAIEEINLLIQLRYNPNIVSIEDYVIKEKDNGIGWDIYIRMELLKSVNELEIAIRNGEAEPLGEEEVRRLGIDICAALEECHNSGLLHRDIKPGNIFVDKDGRYKLGDFGISRVLDQTTGIISATMTNWYAAPEVMRFEKGRVTADIYSLGLVMYELLNGGRLPFMPPQAQRIGPDDWERAMVSRLKGEQVKPIADISDALNRIILKACAFDRNDRFASAKEMKDSLDMIVDRSKPDVPSNADDKEMSEQVTVSSDWELASEQESAAEAFDKGSDYYLGRGVEQNYAQALKWYWKAAKWGHSTAQYNLGVMYENGQGVEQNFEEAVEWYRKAADQGDADSQFNLGVMYDYGRGVEQDDADAVKWYRKAAEQGHATAQYNLGVMYFNGRGVKQDDAEAVKWYRKAAEQGEALAQYNLGVMYFNGSGVEQDDEEAVKWYRKAAEQGDATAEYNMGVMYFNGCGVEQNYAEAVKWYRKAAEQGDAEAQRNLGVMYDNGFGVEHNYSEAVKWYWKAADQGDADAQYNLGVMYHNGIGVVQNYAEAVKWYRRAADQGDAEAQYNLGWMCAKNCGVKQDDTEAVKWFHKAALQGYTSAQSNLGWMYENGRGVEQDNAEAVKWYRKAADQGDPTAQYNLGGMYENGRGVDQNYAEAMKWFRLAAEQGDEDAKRHIRAIRKRRG